MLLEIFWCHFPNLLKSHIMTKEKIFNFKNIAILEKQVGCYKQRKILLVGGQIGTTNLESVWAISYKVKYTHIGLAILSQVMDQD